MVEVKKRTHIRNEAQIFARTQTMYANNKQTPQASRGWGATTTNRQRNIFSHFGKKNIVHMITYKPMQHIP